MLGQDDFCPDQFELTKTPARRSKLANQIIDSVMTIHTYWMPLRIAAHQRTVAKAIQPKVGRNDACPCGTWFLYLEPENSSHTTLPSRLGAVLGITAIQSDGRVTRSSR